jgi:hypothetical protein
MANQFNVRRVAFGNFSLPTNNSANTASTLSADAGVYIPKGAIVTGIYFLPGDAITNGANLKNATVNVNVGSLVLGTNDRVASQALVQTAGASIALSVSPIYVSVGGNVIVHFASSDNARTGIVLDADIYVEYLYCDDRDDK